jgi:hypothetical protein
MACSMYRIFLVLEVLEWPWPRPGPHLLLSTSISASTPGQSPKWRLLWCLEFRQRKKWTHRRSSKIGTADQDNHAQAHRHRGTQEHADMPQSAVLTPQQMQRREGEGWSGADGNWSKGRRKEQIGIQAQPVMQQQRVVGRWDHGVMGRWDHGVMGRWNHGVVGRWDHGVVGRWDHGVMGRWDHGVMGRCSPSIGSRHQPTPAVVY